MAFSLQGCAAFGSAPPPLDTYELTSHRAPETGPNRPRTQILVAEPSALRALDSENIVIRTSPATIEFLGRAQWSDRLPRMVQARLADTFQATDRLGGVGRPGEGLAIDYQVVTDLRAFEVRVYGQPQAVIELSARVLDDRNGVIRATRVFQAEVPVSGSGSDAYVAALDRAYGQVTGELVPWVLSAL